MTSKTFAITVSSVREITEAFLKSSEYDGLCNPSLECGCKIGDLMPCDNPDPDCEPGYLKEADPKTGFDFIIVRDKPEEATDETED